jgi:hypothetical protein
MEEQIIQELARISLKQAMETCARLAEQHAAESAGIDGEDALKAFAAAIRSNSVRQWGGSA